MHKEKIAAVDFGSKKLSISLGVMCEEDIEIIGYLAEESKGIEKGLIKDEIKCTESFVKLVEKFEDKVDEPIQELYVGISSRYVRISEAKPDIFLEDGKVKAKHIKKAISRGCELIHLDEDEVIIDSVINFYTLDGRPSLKNVIGLVEQKLEVSVTYFIAKKEEIEKYQNVIGSAGCTIRGFLVNIYSGKQVFLNGEDADGVRVLVDSGAGTTDYAFFKDGIIEEIGSIPLGGNNVTNDLAICGEYSKSEAENIKLICSDNYVSLYENRDDKDIIEIGESSVSKTLFYEVTKARLEEMLKLLDGKLKNSSYYEDICSIILYGDGMTCYENIDEIVHNELTKKVRIVTKEYLGMKNSLNITSLAIVKEVSDRLILLKEEDTKNDKELEYLLNEKKETEQPKVKERKNNNNNSIVGKIKKILGDIF
ncbi:cell division protein FtsA [Clostridium sp. DSM 8431]|uniref:cell division FtsA domain-containing protein n=1 Tax=Clostridium sp. DSM 8431 TaxID=1761781 RepID=UPI0008EC4908|nr:cell division FtsA domain-containing protein [Clostridium sp. DSM 8431]SFU41760.1 cell division protein FtsA [Clostridium sp. DSM 8431]